MADIVLSDAPSGLVRLGHPEIAQLQEIVFRRYPDREWACFGFFGFRLAGDRLMMSLATLLPPEAGDMDEMHPYAKMMAAYPARIARTAEKDSLAIGIIHSHPKEAAPVHSPTDDDMDTYYADYFAGFTPDRPYLSLILSEVEDVLSIAGRIHWQDRWLSVDRVIVERHPDVETWIRGRRPEPAPIPPARVARFTSAFGKEAHHRLRQSTVAVIGAGGTGSAAIPILARAGVGHLIIADSDHVSDSNLERVHGSRQEHVDQRFPKAMLAYEQVTAIDPTTTVETYIGRLPQPEILDRVVTADVILGCTDQQHSRLVISEISRRYLIPAIDAGGLIEGEHGQVTGQIAQLVRFSTDDPCAVCRGMIDPTRIALELVTEEERERQRQELLAAEARGEEVDPRLRGAVDQINTVGYLTTVIGALAAGYAVGWLSGRYEPPFERLQMNLVAEFLDVTDRHQAPGPDCTCRPLRGRADQAEGGDPRYMVPDHWDPPRRVPA